MTPAITEAAERWTAHSLAENSEGSPYFANHRYDMALHELDRNALADHACEVIARAAQEKGEVTPEWLVEIMGPTLTISSQGGGPVAYFRCSPEYGCDGWTIFNSPDNEVLLPYPKNRSQVLSLLKALGMEGKH